MIQLFRFLTRSGRIAKNRPRLRKQANDDLQIRGIAVAKAELVLKRRLSHKPEQTIIVDDTILTYRFRKSYIIFAPLRTFYALDRGR